MISQRLSTYSSDQPYCFEHVSGKSKTIQGESYTIPELFDRHMKGLIVRHQDQSYYEATDDFDAIDFQALRNADPFEKEELMREVAEKANLAQKALKAWREKKEKEEDDFTKIKSSKTIKESERVADREPSDEPKAKSDASQSATQGKS